MKAILRDALQVSAVDECVCLCVRKNKESFGFTSTETIKAYRDGKVGGVRNFYI